MLDNMTPKEVRTIYAMWCDALIKLGYFTPDTAPPYLQPTRTMTGPGTWMPGQPISPPPLNYEEIRKLSEWMVGKGAKITVVEEFDVPPHVRIKVPPIHGKGPQDYSISGGEGADTYVEAFIKALNNLPPMREFWNPKPDDIKDTDAQETRTPHLFNASDGSYFTLSAGGKTRWLLDCKALTDADWDDIALMIHRQLPYTFHEVFGVPRGGLKFAKALSKYQDKHSKTILVVDDVYTTGLNIEKYRRELNERLVEPHRVTSRPNPELDIRGLVLFNRSQIIPAWIRAIYYQSMWIDDLDQYAVVHDIRSITPSQLCSCCNVRYGSHCGKSCISNCGGMVRGCRSFKE